MHRHLVLAHLVCLFFLSGCGIGLCVNRCQPITASEVVGGFALRSNKPLERITLNSNLPAVENLGLAIESGPIVTGASMGLAVTNGIIAASGTVGATQTSLPPVVVDPDGDGAIGIPLIDANESYDATLSLEFDPAIDPAGLTCQFDPPYDTLPCSTTSPMEFNTSAISSTSDLKARVYGSSGNVTNSTVDPVTSLATRRTEIRQLGSGGWGADHSLALSDSSFLIESDDLYRYYPQTGRFTAAGLGDISGIVEFSSGIYVLAEFGGPFLIKLFRYDPTGNGHLHQITDIRPGTFDFLSSDQILCEVGPYLLMSSYDGAARTALFAYNFNLGTVQQVADTNIGQDDQPYNCTVVNGVAYLQLTVTNANRRELFSFNPSGPTLTQLTSLSTGATSGITSATYYGGKFYLRTDLTAGAADMAKYFIYNVSAGTVTRMTDTSTASGVTDNINYTGATERNLYFYANNAAGNFKFHRHNFASQTTHQVTDLNPGSIDVTNQPLILPYGNGVLFGSRNTVGGKWYFFDEDDGALGTVYQLSNQNIAGDDGPDELTPISGKALGDRWFVGISDATTRGLYGFEKGSSWSSAFFTRMGKLAALPDTDLNTCCLPNPFTPHTNGLAGTFAWDTITEAGTSTGYSIDFLY